MRKIVWAILVVFSCTILFGGCKERSKELINDDVPIENTVVDEKSLETYGSLIGLSDEEVVSIIGEGTVDAGYRLIDGYTHYLPREYEGTPFRESGKTTVTFFKDETYQAKYYGEEIPFVAGEIYIEMENANRDFVVEVFQSFAAILGELDCQYGNLKGKYADGFWVDKNGILYVLSMDEKSATESGKVDLYLRIQRDDGYRAENFGRYEKC